ncbi:hypothetical protein J6590_034054 [Homalodisca vitripennis]|nr:hypothetical protein J6590_034054 [Homalodisca vitripennis]
MKSGTTRAEVRRGEGTAVYFRNESAQDSRVEAPGAQITVNIIIYLSYIKAVLTYFNICARLCVMLSIQPPSSHPPSLSLRFGFFELIPFTNTTLIWLFPHCSPLHRFGAFSVWVTLVTNGSGRIIGLFKGNHKDDNSIPSMHFSELPVTADRCLQTWTEMKSDPDHPGRGNNFIPGGSQILSRRMAGRERDWDAELCGVWTSPVSLRLESSESLSLRVADGLPASLSLLCRSPISSLLLLPGKTSHIVRDTITAASDTMLSIADSPEFTHHTHIGFISKNRTKRGNISAADREIKAFRADPMVNHRQDGSGR